MISNVNEAHEEHSKRVKVGDLGGYMFIQPLPIHLPRFFPPSCDRL